MAKDTLENTSSPMPEGLDEFLASPSPSMGASPETQEVAVESPMPEGLEEFIAPEVKQEKYGGLGQQAITAVEGAAQGLVGPLAPMVEKALGVEEEDILARKEANPITHGVGEVAGLVAPAILTAGSSTAARGVLGTAAKFSQMGLVEAGVKKLGLVAGETLASKVGVAAAKGAVENMLLAGSDEVSKMVLHDPEQSAQTAMINVGLAGALGGVLSGGIVGATEGGAKLWKATVGDKAGKLVEDFKARIKSHVDNPDPVASMGEEMGGYYKSIKDTADEVYGPAGLKAQDITKALPEAHAGIQQQVGEITSKVESAIKKLGDDPMAKKLSDTLERYKAEVTSARDSITNAPIGEKSVSDVFEATQNLKQQLQEWGKFNKQLVPVAEHDFRGAAKNLAYDLRGALEDSNVWGKAAVRQKTINKAFSEYLPALKDFEKKFTVEVGGVRQIDPGKINTYLNQLGKPNAEIKQQMLDNFLKASEKYKKVIHDTHANLGIPTEHINTPMNLTMASLDKKTLGAKLADAFIDKGLTEVGGASLGASVGGALGAMVGHAGIGAIVGSHALGPLFKSILPSIAKSLVEAPTSTGGFKAAIDYVASVAKADASINKAVKNVFKAGSAVLPGHMLPTEKQREKINRQVMQIQKNPMEASTADNKVNSYLPSHATAMDMTTANAVTYLNSIRADTARQSPLDSKPAISSTQKAEFDNALNIAQSPLLVLEKIKDGTMTTKDMTHLSKLYPALYVGLQNKLLSEMVNHADKGGTVPYKTRITLSMFLASPMDSTMRQESIMSAQVSMAGMPDPQGGAQTKASKGVKSSPALQKMPNMYQTPGQARLSRKTK